MNNLSNLVELIDRQLESKTGAFVNPKTGNTWQVYRKNEQLIIEVPNFSFQIYPFSPTRFKPVNTSMNIEIEFVKQNQPKSLQMDIYTKGIKRATFSLF